jgi:putative flippase GtrA
LKLIKGELVPYVVVSLIALLVDVFSLYVLIVAFDTRRPVAAVGGYLAGLIVHYLLAVSVVFGYRRFGQHQGLEFVGYVATGLIGVVTNYVVIFAGTEIDAALWESKTAAVTLSFGLTYIARRWWLFSRRQQVSEALRK